MGICGKHPQTAVAFGIQAFCDNDLCIKKFLTFDIIDSPEGFLYSEAILPQSFKQLLRIAVSNQRLVTFLCRLFLPDGKLAVRYLFCQVAYLMARSVLVLEERVLRYALGYSLWHEMPQLWRSMCYGYALWYRKEIFHRTDCNFTTTDFLRLLQFLSVFRLLFHGKIHSRHGLVGSQI